ASFLTPLSAGGLNDFLKKGKDTKTENPQPAPSKDSDRATPNQNSDNGVDLWRKQRRDPAPTEDKKENSSSQSSTPDLFRKGTPSQSTPRSNTGASDSRPTDGLPDLFRKPRRQQPMRFKSSVPTVVRYHFNDPSYYPYDRLFYEYYYPYAAREQESWLSQSYPALDWNEESALSALRAIERGWREGDYSRIAPYVDADERIAVYENGEYSHDMSAGEFAALTLQAFADTQTVRFRFYNNRMLGSDEMRAEGEHVFDGPDGEERRVELSYTLRHEGRRWYIRAIDMREQHNFTALRSLDADTELTLLPAAACDVTAVPDNATEFAAVGSTDILTEPGTVLVTPQVTLPETQPVVIAASPSPQPVTAIPVAARMAAPRVQTLQVECVSTPLRLTQILAARQPVKAATVTYLVGQARATYAVFLAPARGGVKWSILHQGEKGPRENGILSTAMLQRAARGRLLVIVDRVDKPRMAAAGEQRLPLLTRTGWNYQTLLLLSPKTTGKLTRTKLVLSAEPR
ncbi:MAG TPA: hypothetical protein VHR86_08420, partial [Armatimonadota bacterium]|nr:hypothetical protein [Armatimonadota bacterium]